MESLCRDPVTYETNIKRTAREARRAAHHACTPPLQEARTRGGRIGCWECRSGPSEGWFTRPAPALAPSILDVYGAKAGAVSGRRFTMPLPSSTTKPRSWRDTLSEIHRPKGFTRL